MTLGELLQDKKDAIVRRWLDDVLATYPGESSAAFFKRQEDLFANPVGHSLRVGTLGIFEALLEGMDDEKIRPHLRGIIKMRAVQEFSASEAVGFVFRLKEAIRVELPKAVEDPQLSSDWAKLEGQIDRMALAAFDVFVECREQVCELRLNEMKRSVSWILDKLNQRGSDPELAQIDLK